MLVLAGGPEFRDRHSSDGTGLNDDRKLGRPLCYVNTAGSSSTAIMDSELYEHSQAGRHAPRRKPATKTTMTCTLASALGRPLRPCNFRSAVRIWLVYASLLPFPKHIELLRGRFSCHRCPTKQTI